MGRRKHRQRYQSLDHEAARFGITIDRKETLQKKRELKLAWTWLFQDSAGVVLKWYPDQKNAHMPRSNRRMKVESERESLDLARRVHGTRAGSSWLRRI